MADDARIGLLLDGRYRIEKRIAAGGMGVVYRAERVGLAKRVAVKFLHRSSASMPLHRQRFLREAAVMGRLTHPNLVSVFDYGALDDVPYLVMEYHQGEPLRRLLQGGALAPERAVYIARQILAGARCAHDSGVVHRDLKPANVLLVGNPGDDLVKILDFGVAKLLEGSGGPSEVSVLGGGLLGTPRYMSPEQARAEPVDGRADLYAIGIILYQMVTGRRPFRADGDLAMLRKQVEDPPPPPRDQAPHLSAALEAAILRALEKDREHRWPTAAHFSEALAATPEGERSMPRREAIPERVPESQATERVRERRPARRRLLAPLLLLLLAAAAAAAFTAAERGWVELAWPSWMPWRSSESRSDAPAVAPPPRASAGSRPPPAAQPPPADAAPAPDAAPPRRDAAALDGGHDGGAGRARDGGAARDASAD